MKNFSYGLTACILLLTTALIGCDADEQPKEGSAEIVKSNSPPAELPPELKDRETDKMKRGGYDPNHPEASRGHR